MNPQLLGREAPHRFAVLFAALLLAVLAPALAPTKGLWWILTLTLAFALVAGLVAVAENRRHLVVGFLCLSTAVLLGILARLQSHSGLGIAAHVFSTAFLLFVAVHTLRYVLRAKRVTSEILFAAVSVYLLFGYTCGLIYHAIYLAQPDAFSGAIIAADDQASLFYFSFVTLTTLGYGDVLPAAAAARGLAIFEALVGQLFLVVLVARLVALQIVHSSEDDE